MPLRKEDFVSIKIKSAVKTEFSKSDDSTKKLPEAKDKNEEITKITFKQKVSLCMLATVEFTSYCSMSMMAPFFPREAAKKDMSETMAGFVFSFYALVVFLSSPVFGKILPKMGVNYTFIAGVLLSGTCSILFGCLQYVDNSTAFTTLSFLIRGAEALGASAYATAGYVVVITMFPRNGGVVRGVLETFVGLGMSVGPAIGGFLFAIGGFGLPFYVLGLTSILIAPLNVHVLPPNEEYDVNVKSGSFTDILKLPSVIVTCLVIVVVSASWGFLDPTLEPHLRRFDISAGNVGLIFLLLSAMYGISSPAWGFLSDKIVNYWCLLPLGLLFSCFSFLCIGPSPVLPFLEDSLMLNVISLSVLGVFVAMAIIPTYQGIVDSAVEGGFSDSLGTHSIVAALWSSSYSLGEMLGPAIGGTLLQVWGFPRASTTIAGLNFVCAVISGTFFLTRRKRVVKCELQENVKESKEQFTKTETELKNFKIEALVLPTNGKVVENNHI